MSNRIPEKYRKAVRTAMLSAAAAGPIGAFSTVADVGSIAAVWGTLLMHVARTEGHQMSKETAVKLCGSIAVGAGGYYMGCKAATKLFHAIPIPGAGTALAIGCSTVENLVFTYYFAAAVISVFSARGKNGLGDLVTSVVKVFRHFSMFDMGEMAMILIG